VLGLAAFVLEDGVDMRREARFDGGEELNDLGLEVHGNSIRIKDRRADSLPDRRRGAKANSGLVLLAFR
jgi:hypothetical protein